MLFLLATLPVPGHPWKPEHYVIIDIDGGTDHIRAIRLLLPSPGVSANSRLIASPEPDERLNYVYGLDRNIYREPVRKRSLLNRKNLGRDNIFEITEIK